MKPETSARPLVKSGVAVAGTVGAVPPGEDAAFVVNASVARVDWLVIVALLPNWSCAVTRTEKAVPAVSEAAAPPLKFVRLFVSGCTRRFPAGAPATEVNLPRFVPPGPAAGSPAGSSVIVRPRIA